MVKYKRAQGEIGSEWGEQRIYLFTKQLVTFYLLSSAMENSNAKGLFKYKVYPSRYFQIIWK